MTNDKSICLVIVYNHNYEKNIPILDRLYGHRFSRVLHIMPFYRGENPNVIGVYENSFQFSGYIAQAFPRILSTNSRGYLFIADDMILNPDVTEENVADRLCVSDGSNFICEASLMTAESVRNWSHALTSVIFFNAKGNACEGIRFLPSKENARKRFLRCGMDWRMGVSERFVKWFAPWVMPMKTTPGDFFPLPGMRAAMRLARLLPDATEPVYPLAGGYSDLFAVSCESMPEFARYCGILAAMRVHVEVAIPTALVLASRSLNTAKSLGISYVDGVRDYALRDELEKRFEFSVRRLCEKFDQEILFYHPIKLSKWTDIP